MKAEIINGKAYVPYLSKTISTDQGDTVEFKAIVSDINYNEKPLVGINGVKHVEIDHGDYIMTKMSTPNDGNATYVLYSIVNLDLKTGLFDMKYDDHHTSESLVRARRIGFKQLADRLEKEVK